MLRASLPRLQVTRLARSVALNRSISYNKRTIPSILSQVTARLQKMVSPRLPPLQHSDGPLIWIDCEMTGLNHKTDRIIEIAVLITNGNLEVMDEGLRYAIQTDKEILDEMDDWCTKTHGDSGLIGECLSSPHTLSEVEQHVLQYVQRWIPPQRVGILAGSSVHVDRQFLCEQMPLLIEHLHYRIVDCSTIKELAYRWYPKRLPERVYQSKHRALDDIKDSIADLAWHRKLIFKDPMNV